MALEVYYPQDIRNALLAAEHVVDATAEAMAPRDAPYAAGFLAGYRAALATIALAFGLALPPDDPVVAWASLYPEAGGSRACTATVASVHVQQGER